MNLVLVWVATLAVAVLASLLPGLKAASAEPNIALTEN